jgi:hypothetical protein
MYVPSKIQIGEELGIQQSAKWSEVSSKNKFKVVIFCVSHYYRVVYFVMMENGVPRPHVIIVVDHPQRVSRTNREIKIEALKTFLIMLTKSKQ